MFGLNDDIIEELNDGKREGLYDIIGFTG